MRIITIVNQKGGCGKTTTAINLSAMLARRGTRTLLIDMDPQSHCAAGLGVPEHRIDLDIGDAMLAAPTKAIDTGRLLWRAGRNLDLCPSRMRVAGLEAARGGLADRPDRERRLAQVIERFRGEYDAVVIDCSPSVGLLTFNALAAATHVLVPVETGYFSLQGATKQVSTVKSLGRRLGVQFPVWLLATIHDESSPVACDLLEELRRRFMNNTVPVVIRRDVKLREACSFGQPVSEYAPESVGAQDYASLAEWTHNGLKLKGSTVAARDLSPDEAISETIAGGLAEDAATGTTSTSVDAAVARMLNSTEAQRGPDDTAVGAPAIGATTGDGRAGDTMDLAAVLRNALLGTTSGTPSSASDAAASAGSFVGASGSATPPETMPADAQPLSRAAELVQRAQRLLKRTEAEAKPLPAMPPASAPARVPLRLSEGVEVKSADTAPRRLLGVHITRQGVLFVQPLGLGTNVAVAGDFNGWSSHATPMRRNDAMGVWEACVPIPPGTYQYRLVVDGHWASDSFNPRVTTNPFGEANNQLIVPAVTNVPTATEALVAGA